jgi:hypothetical protein
MKSLLIFAGAAAVACSAPALAKPGHGNGGCPPGLAKKAVPCMPPGQAKKLYGVGQRLPAGAFSPFAYNSIPYDVRRQYGLSRYGTYYYGDGYLYRVNPRTMLIQQVIRALLYR